MSARNMSARFRSRFLVLAVAAGLLVFGLAVFRVGPPPDVAIEPELPGIGPRTPVTVRVAEPRRGVSDVKVELIQGERSESLAERSFEPRPFWAFWGDMVAREEIELEVGRESLPELAEGEATLRVTAGRAPTWFRHPGPAVAEKTLPVSFKPPSIQVTSRETYVAQGGSAVVTYRVDSDTMRDGVRVGERWFPGYSLPGGGPTDRFAFFAAPHDGVDPGAIRLEATDELGNVGKAKFVDRYLPEPMATDDIRLSDGFFEKVVPEILAQFPAAEDRGELLATYLAMNGDLRVANAETLMGLTAGTKEEFLWTRPFLQLPNSRVMAGFAERRTYLYDGRKVDQQDHLGFDLASVRQAPVPAANRGVVLMAEYFGIYGNTVVVDHGYGLFSLYGHLSSIDVAVGQEVARGDVLGRTGETGLAGGDHLHFAILVHGMPVNPLEWWDPAWIRNRVADDLGAALEFEE